MRKGHPLRIDPTANSADPVRPTFLARPEGTPVYYGFEIIKESQTDGWYYGAITDYETDEPSTEGDGFVIAPDGSRAGIAWATDSPEFYEICPPDKERWGVYGVRFPQPVKCKADLICNFQCVLPLLKRRFTELIRSKEQVHG